jgi:hypothetical protein
MLKRSCVASVHADSDDQLQRQDDNFLRVSSDNFQMVGPHEDTSGVFHASH